MTKVSLQWSKLLGFDQLSGKAREDCESLTEPRMAKIGGRISVKPGDKLAGLTKIGGKTGMKPA